MSAQLAALGHECRIEIIKTTGDKITDVPLAKVGTRACSPRKSRKRCWTGRADLAVHSLKDLPTELPAGLVLAAVPEREDPRDAVVGKRAGRSAARARESAPVRLRRAAQLRKLRPDLAIESVRGNLDTRLRKLDEGQYDAILLAAAGLKRLGWGDRIAEILPPETMCSGGGAGRAGHRDAQRRRQAATPAQSLDHTPTHTAVTAERALLAALGGGCQVPIGAHAVVTDGDIKLIGVVARPDGSTVIREVRHGKDPVKLGEELGCYLLGHGGREILQEVYGETVVAPAQP